MKRKGERIFHAEGIATIKVPGKDLGMFPGPNASVDDESKSKLREGWID